LLLDVVSSEIINRTQVDEHALHLSVCMLLHTAFLLIKVLKYTFLPFILLLL